MKLEARLFVRVTSARRNREISHLREIHVVCSAGALNPSAFQG
jgi:hypothetical protein